MGRMIPFVAIAAANCINIPLVRQHELKNGVPVYDSQGNLYGESQDQGNLYGESQVCVGWWAGKKGRGEMGGAM